MISSSRWQEADKFPSGNSASQASRYPHSAQAGTTLGDAEDQKTAEEIVARAIDGGVTFFDRNEFADSHYDQRDGVT